MAVRPVQGGFRSDGSVDVVHEEQAHAGTVAFADVRYGRAADGSVTLDAIELPCPVCGMLSVHPVAGGCAPALVQLLHARTLLRRAAAVGIPIGQRTWLAIRARIKARVEATDGVGRFRLDALQSEDDPLPEGG